MEKISVNISAEKSYEIIIGAGILTGGGLSEFLPQGKKYLIVTDANINKIYKEFIDRAKLDKIVLPPGEEEKKLENIERICREASKSGLDRSSVIVALGGGVIGDMAGFAASVYMRGIDFIQVPTTLLAMLDSSVGGKTGVDLPEGKNLIGTFWQPSKVIADIRFLETLPPREIKCGLAELVKYAVILDEEFFAMLEKNIEKLKKLDADFYQHIIAKSCKLKAFVVEKDEKESGLRAILNYGHTFGHAIEKAGAFTAFSHGEAVAIGMRMAAKFAVLIGMMEESDEPRQNSLLDELDLPAKAALRAEDVYGAMFSDKKTRSGKLRIVVPKKIGEVEIIEPQNGETVQQAIRFYCEK